MAESDPGVTDGEQPLPTLLPAEAIPMPKSNDHPCPRGLGQDDLTKEKGITQSQALDQQCQIELSAMMDMFSIYTVQYGGH